MDTGGGCGACICLTTAVKQRSGASRVIHRYFEGTVSASGIKLKIRHRFSGDF